jgi:hypothetical protein
MLFEVSAGFVIVDFHDTGNDLLSVSIYSLSDTTDSSSDTDKTVSSCFNSHFVCSFREDL